MQIKYLATLVSEQELDQNGIEVRGAQPQRVPIITFPKFVKDIEKMKALDYEESLLEKHLTRKMWSDLKPVSTSRGGNLQIVVKSGVSNPHLPIGVMATDEEAFKVFGDLFKPII